MFLATPKIRGCTLYAFCPCHAEASFYPRNRERRESNPLYGRGNRNHARLHGSFLPQLPEICQCKVLSNAVTGKVAHSTRMDAFESAKQSTSLRMSILLADQSAGDLR